MKVYLRTPHTEHRSLQVQQFLLSLDGEVILFVWFPSKQPIVIPLHEEVKQFELKL